MQFNEHPLGTVTVLDIETAPCPFLVAEALKGGPANRPALHKVTGWSLLSATETADRRWTDFKLQTRSGDSEWHVLFDLDEALTAAQEKGATLVTYNGEAHDLPMLQRRTIANWLFGVPGLANLHAMPHRDLFREATRGGRTNWPSLRDLCTAWGIPTDHMAVSGDRTPAGMAHRKSQTDVIATLLLFGFGESSGRGEARTVSRLWLALADYLKRPEVRQPHLAQFTSPALLKRAAEEADLDA